MWMHSTPPAIWCFISLRGGAGLTATRQVQLEPGLRPATASHVTAPGIAWDYASDPAGNVVAEGPGAASPGTTPGGSPPMTARRSWRATSTTRGQQGVPPRAARSRELGRDPDDRRCVRAAPHRGPGRGVGGDARARPRRGLAGRDRPHARDAERRARSSTTSATTSAAPTWCSTRRVAQAAREEYFPFGETSLGGLAGQRHRFTGRSATTRACSHTTAPASTRAWLGRWVSREPLPAPRLIQGASPFAYARGNPLRLIDVQGTQEYRPRPHLPRDTDPVARPPDPEFPAWFTADQKKAFIDQHQALGADRAKRDCDPDTGDKNLPYDPYLASERRAMVAGEIARQLLILALTTPAILGRLFGLGSFIRLGAGESMAAASVTAEESLAAHLARLEAEGVNVQRQAWVHVTAADPIYGQVVNHGGAFVQNGRIYVNMDVIGGGVVERGARDRAREPSGAPARARPPRSAEPHRGPRRAALPLERAVPRQRGQRLGQRRRPGHQRGRPARAARARQRQPQPVAGVPAGRPQQRAVRPEPS